MRRDGALIPAAVGAGLFGAAALAGPMIAAGGVLALGLAGVIYAFPIVGLAFMVVSGTALQSLGSEHISGLPMSLNKVAGLLTLGAWALRSALLRQPITWSRQLPALGLFIFAVWAGSLVAPDPGEAFAGLVRYAQLALLTVMIANIAAESARTLDQACLALTGALALSAILALMEFLIPGMALESDDPSLEQGNIGAIIDRDSIDGVEVKRVTGGTGDSNILAYTVAAVLPINLYLLHRYRTPGARLAILAMTALQGIALVLSFTRSGVLALGVSVLVLVLRGRLPVLPLLAAGLVAVLGFAAWSPAGIERMYSLSYATTGGSTPLRTYIMLGALELIAQRPITGYGYNQFGPNFMPWLAAQPDLPQDVVNWERGLLQRVNEGLERLEWTMPHNTVMQVWIEFGLLGFLAMGALIVFIFRDLADARRHGTEGERVLADCLTAAAAGFLVSAMFGHLALYKIVWILSGYAAALRRVAISARAGAA
jgi:O-antigen ligase